MKLDKIIDILKNLILDVVIIILIGAVIVGALNKRKPISIFGYYFFTVTTGSMEDTIMVDDSIIVKKTDNFKIGDIVTYAKDDTYVTHRIIEIDDNYVVTKGDANLKNDPPISKSQILGKFVYKSNWLTFLVKYKMIIVLIIAILYVSNLLIKNIKKLVIKNA